MIRIVNLLFLLNLDMAKYAILGNILALYLSFLLYFIWQKIIYEDSIPETRKWFMLLVLSDLKRCIKVDLVRSLLLCSFTSLVSTLHFITLILQITQATDTYYKETISTCVMLMYIHTL